MNSGTRLEITMMWMELERRGRDAAGGLALVSALLLSPTMARAQTDSNPQTTQGPPSVTATAAPEPPGKGQELFPTAELAVKALVAAVQAQNAEAQSKILGPDAEKILSSSDAAQDQQDRNLFMTKYAQMHRLLTEPDGLTTLYIGAENWPWSIPLAREGHKWYFDTPAGEREILYRRIGRNEVTVIQVCAELVQAEKEYYEQANDGSGQQYAARFNSSPGKRNGLYWPAAAGQPPSPLGPVVTQAAEEGHAAALSPRTPFYGYYFRLLKAQGPNAPGGAKNYIVDGKMTGGFAFVAYPAEYRSSGVMTFMVGPDGVVYQKNLGPQTAELAPKIDVYQVNSTWQKAD